MKLRNPGHELDNEWESLKEELNRKIFIWGAGIIGRQVFEQCSKFVEPIVPEAFIDNSVEKQKSGYLNKQVMSADEFFDLPDLKNSYIIISLSKSHCNEIIQQLERRQYYSYVLYDEFENRILPIIAAYKYNKSYMNLAQIVVTERCTLKCKKCAHGCYAVNNKSKDMPLDEVKRTADIFFSKVDYIEEFVLIGGEPLLYNELADAVDYIADRYSDHIGIFSITTNGTIIPHDDLLKSCREHHVLFRISNYTAAIHRLKERYNNLCQVLENNDVAYVLQEEDSTWIDYGFDYLNDPIDEKRLTARFDSCHTPCRDVRGNRLYFCVQARAVSDNLKLDELDDDYLDLTLLGGIIGRRNYWSLI